MAKKKGSKSKLKSSSKKIHPYLLKSSIDSGLSRTGFRFAVSRLQDDESLDDSSSFGEDVNLQNLTIASEFHSLADESEFTAPRVSDLSAPSTSNAGSSLSEVGQIPLSSDGSKIPTFSEHPHGVSPPSGSINEKMVTLRVTLKEEQATNERLKRMKMDLKIQAAAKGAAAFASEEPVSDQTLEMLAASDPDPFILRLSVSVNDPTALPALSAPNSCLEVQKEVANPCLFGTS